ncbi:PadR family transcriptional regulator [Nonomuraea terrae]|uniref:PadR family transcriptional regulator n=1 Tax=Nonomuraea terrae TaxID=2530383 RepID=UPI0037B9F842
MPEDTEATPGSATIARLRRELARGTTELAVLSVLSVRRRYGYELLKVLRETGEGVLEVKEGTLYPLLHRLEDSGHIRASWEAEGRARPRKYYVLTPDGRAYLGMLRAEWGGLVDGMRQLLDTLGEVQEWPTSGRSSTTTRKESDAT